MPEDVDLAVFDVDGTLTASVAVDEECYLQAFDDVLGVRGVSTNWLEYAYQTDSGLAVEVCRKHLGREPGEADTARLQARFVELLRAAFGPGGRPLREVPGAGAFLRHLRGHPRWRVAIATGG